ncbi:putative metallopeptidase [Clostridium sp. MB40-C1]|uniref:putative metallopeptidase n=1 Tax=Clostridium sp. MB40-C1 TaxID=3070996 RepID=UPI0027DEC0ED|nr:putative metallopeptidase [Clostridium sp. MB40-C1]WMJ81956.1 putative metallopeptidase [Clostridium sp. MB40-C1]
MPKIRIIADTGELINDIECIGYNLQYVDADGNGQVQKIRALNNGKYDSKHWIKNEFYKPLAEKIKDKYKEQIPEFTYININKLLFLEDIDYVGDEMKRNDDVMWIKKAPRQLTDLTGYKFIIFSREFWMSRISKEQILWHIYSVLRQVDGDKLREPDIKGWKEVLGTLGYGWETTLTPMPNLMDGFEDEDFTMLKKADRQLKFDLRNAK